MLLGADILVADEPCQIMVLVVDEILEIIVERIGITERVAFGVVERDDGMSRIFLRSVVAHLIRGKTEETLVVLCIVVVTKFCLCCEVLDELPSERSAEIEVLTVLLAVVVGSRGDRIVEVHVIVVKRGVLSGETLQGDRRIDDSVLESLVGVVRACCIVCTSTTDVGVAETGLEIKHCVFGGL